MSKWAWKRKFIERTEGEWVKEQRDAVSSAPKYGYMQFAKIS